MAGRRARRRTDGGVSAGDALPAAVEDLDNLSLDLLGKGTTVAAALEAFYDGKEKLRTKLERKDAVDDVVKHRIGIKVQLQLHQISTGSAEAIAKFQKALIYLGTVNMDAVRQKDQTQLWPWPGLASRQCICPMLQSKFCWSLQQLAHDLALNDTVGDASAVGLRDEVVEPVMDCRGIGWGPRAWLNLQLPVYRQSSLRQCLERSVAGGATGLWTQ